MKLKISLDLHGVANETPPTCPDFFPTLTKLLVDNGHDVIIMTGSRDSQDLRDELDAMKLSYTQIISVTSYLEAKSDVPLTYDEKGNPHAPAEIWDPIKAKLAEEHGIHLHFDDSDNYILTEDGTPLFKTPVARYWSNDKPKMKRIKQYGKPPLKVLV